MGGVVGSGLGELFVSYCAFTLVLMGVVSGRGSLRLRRPIPPSHTTPRDSCDARRGYEVS